MTNRVPTLHWIFKESLTELKANELKVFSTVISLAALEPFLVVTTVWIGEGSATGIK